MGNSNFGKFFDKLAWAALTCIALYASSQLSKMSDSVQALNTNIAVIVTKMEGYEIQSNEIKGRVSTLEEKIFSMKK